MTRISFQVKVSDSLELNNKLSNDIASGRCRPLKDGDEEETTNHGNINFLAQTILKARSRLKQLFPKGSTSNRALVLSLTHVIALAILIASIVKYVKLSKLSRSMAQVWEPVLKYRLEISSHLPVFRILRVTPCWMVRWIWTSLGSLHSGVYHIDVLLLQETYCRLLWTRFGQSYCVVSIMGKCKVRPWSIYIHISCVLFIIFFCSIAIPQLSFRFW